MTKKIIRLTESDLQNIVEGCVKGVFKSRLNEAPAKIKEIVGGLFSFNKETTDSEIIETILRDFVRKCVGIIRDTAAPNCGLNSLYIYKQFFQRYGVDNAGDCSLEEIYRAIPTKECQKIYKKEYPKLAKIFSPEDFAKMFQRGEFPSITIWKGYHEGLEEIHVTYSISR